MRAYAVLAGVLEAKGAIAPAALFRRAVNAIRISERSDEFHRLGLYERAFAGYREALEQFADAYCIQSRLAVRLMEQGRREEAFEHYRRAYELMPASFGRSRATASAARACSRARSSSRSPKRCSARCS